MKNFALVIVVALIGNCCGQLSLSTSQCPLDPSCGKVLEPVCGTDGVTYDNLCRIDQAQCRYLLSGKILDVDHVGACVKVPAVQGATTLSGCPDNCDRHTERAPVCGTDGNTYQNSCYFDQAACRYKLAGIRFGQANRGPCSSTVTGTNVNPAISPVAVSGNGCDLVTGCDSTVKAPVCGSDGVTYVNKCILYQTKCKYASAGKQLDMRHEGECRSAPVTSANDVCNDAKMCASTATAAVRTAICDTDGGRHANKCEFLQVACKYSMNGMQLDPVRCADSSVVG